MEGTVINSQHDARIASAALTAATALLVVSYESGSDIVGAIFYGAFVASLVGGLATLSYALLSHDSDPGSRHPA